MDLVVINKEHECLCLDLFHCEYCLGVCHCDTDPFPVVKGKGWTVAKRIKNDLSHLCERCGFFHTSKKCIT